MGSVHPHVVGVGLGPGSRRVSPHTCVDHGHVPFTPLTSDESTEPTHKYEESSPVSSSSRSVRGRRLLARCVSSGPESPQIDEKAGMETVGVPTGATWGQDGRRWYSST